LRSPICGQGVYIKDFGAFTFVVEEGKDGKEGYSRKPVFALHPKFSQDHNVKAGKNVIIPGMKFYVRLRPYCF